MSAKGFAAWRRRYYPRDARTASGGSELEMVRHALRKWRGLNSNTLKAFGLHREHYEIYSGSTSVFQVASSTCALCWEHPDCGGCSLSVVRGLTPCDKELFDEAESPWHAFTACGDTQLMIRWLKRTERKLVANGGKPIKA